VLQIYEQKIKVMKCIKSFHHVLKTIVEFKYMKKGEEHLIANIDSWQVRLKHLYNIYRLQGQNNYYTLQTS